MITEVTQAGETFGWTHIYPRDAKVTNNFTIGKESDMETIGGKKFKVGGRSRATGHGVRREALDSTLFLCLFPLRPL